MDQVPQEMRTALPSAILAWCLAELFECFYMISNDSEDFFIMSSTTITTPKKKKK